MHRTCALLCLLFVVLCMDAITVIDVSGSQTEFEYEQIVSSGLVTFNSSRTRGDKTVSETWRGIALVAWLESQGYSSWHEIVCKSIDAYEVNLHRMELDEIPAYIAFEYQGETLAETDVRVIFPGLRDNMWLRGLTTIKLKGYEAYPHPYLVRSLNSVFSSDNTVPVGKFINEAMHQQQGTLVILDADMQAIRLEYPKHLSGVSLLWDSENKSLGLSLSQIGNMKLKDIVYIQCGPMAYVSEAYLGNLQAIAKPLGWQWESIKAKKSYQQLQTPYATGASLVDKDDYWVVME